MHKHCLKRKSPLLIGLFFLISSIAEGQLNPPVGSSPWKFANPTPVGHTWTDMSFINDNVGLAVGANGGIGRTTDGGRNWVSIPYKFVTNTGSVSLASFNDVQFVTPTTAYAVGSGGLMVKSTDGGVNWSPVTTPLTALGKNINALHFLNKDTGYIGGAAINTTNTTSINDAPKIYITKNGGVTWDSLVTPFRPQQNNVTLSGFNQSEINRLYFVNDSVGYVSGSCGSALPTYSAILWKIEKNVVKDYSIHRSKFGISSTTLSYAPATQTFKGLLGINDSLVIISSVNNNVVIRVKTGKNDSTASAAPAVFGAYERGVYEIVIWLNSTATPFPANLVGIVAGQMQQIKKGIGGKIFMTAGNSILNSTDNGTTWNFTKPHPATVNYQHWAFNALDITPNGRIVIGTFNGLVYDSLPGTSWQTVYKNVKPLFYAFNDMDWADPCNGIVVGSTGTIIKTSDGGKTWIDNSSPVFDAAGISLGAVSYQAVNNMFFTAGTTIYKSADQGTNYNAIFTEPNVNTGGFNSFTMVGPNIAFAIGYRFSPEVQRAVIFRSLNANAASPVWDTVKTFPTGTLAPQLRNIKFANQDTGYVCGNRGKVYRTVNGGATWTDISPDTTVNGNGTTTYTALSVVNGKTVFIGGNNRKIFKSFDAGVTWIDMTFTVPPAPTPFSSFSSIGGMIMNDANNGYAYSGGALMRTSDGWSSWVYDLAPGGFGNFYMYPKMAAPIENKKIYGMPLSAGSSVNSTNTAFLTEYGNATFVNLATAETVTKASCTNPTGGSITISATGGIAPYTYSINGGAFQSSNVFNGLTQGAKTIVIKDAGCQSVTKTITVGFDDNLTLTTNADTVVCANAPVQMLAITNSTTTTYSWSPAAGLTSAAISNPVATTNNAVGYTVTATLNGCVRTKTINIGIKPNPVITAAPNKTIVDGDQAQLTGTANNPVTIAWTPSNTLTGANTLFPVAKPSATTVYTLTVKDVNSCTSTATATITVIPYCIKVRNAFTPNGDGINDKWLVTNGAPCTSQITAAVFNRYGQQVYKNENYQDNWDGMYNGKPVADGTYYYAITFHLINGITFTVKGDLTILR
jgi:gliding motility-associated-like protein